MFELTSQLSRAICYVSFSFTGIKPIILLYFRVLVLNMFFQFIKTKSPIFNEFPIVEIL